MENSPINDMLEVKTFLVLCVRAGVEAKKDGVIDQKDFMLMGPPLLALMPALDNITDIKNELAKLDDNLDLLVGSIASDLGLADDSDVKVYVEQGAQILKAVYKILSKAKAV